MLFLTAATIGLCAGLTRSAVSMTLAACLIPVAFAAGCAISLGPAQYLDLGIAILGYNAGLISLLIGIATVGSRRTA